MLFSENEWYMITSIILDVHKSPDNKFMRKRFLERIRFLIPYDKANFFLSANDENHYIEDSVDVDFEKNYLNNYFNKLEKVDFLNWIYASAQNAVFILSELISQEHEKKDIYVRNYFKANEIEYAIICSLSFNDIHVGTMSLFRSKESGDFTAKDKSALNIIKDHLSLYLYKEISPPENMMSNHDNAPNYTPLDYIPLPKQLRILNLINKYGLTPRESEILKMLLYGENSETICNKLFISNGTLRKHISNIYRKFGVSRRNELNKIIYNE